MSLFIYLDGSYFIYLLMFYLFIYICVAVCEFFAYLMSDLSSND